MFNGLNALKPDMITEATKNARASADRFAADSGSQVGSIRSANQGVFSISAADAVSGMAPGEDAGGGGQDHLQPALEIAIPQGVDGIGQILHRIRVRAGGLHGVGQRLREG